MRNRITERFQFCIGICQLGCAFPQGFLGALHGETVIAADDRALLDSANRLDLTASADAFTRIATEILAADRAAADARRATLDALGLA